MLREGSYRKPACRPRSFPRPLSAPQSPDPTTLFPILPGPERGTALPLPVAPRCAPPPSVWLMGLATPGSFVSRPGIRSSLFPHFASFSSPGTPFPGVHCGARPLAFARCPLPTLPNFHSPPPPHFACRGWVRGLRCSRRGSLEASNSPPPPCSRSPSSR